jgi:hypothetical protein
MNSDLDNDSEAFYSSFMAWLQEDSDPRIPADGNSSDATGVDLEMDAIDLLDVEELNIVYSSTDEVSSSQPSTNLGDLPTVQNRFQALLKRRLQDEIECRPPLFPWETEITDYESDSSDDLLDRWVPTDRLWMPQLSHLSLPVPMPDKVLAQLLTACTSAVQSQLQQGAKMVRAVGGLFPDQPQVLLNQLAGLVMLYPSRSSQEQQLFTDDYATATSEQKTAISLLAAREILNALTLSVSPSQSPVRRQWQTAVGQVSIQAEYQHEGRVPKLRVQSRLPKGGRLTLRTSQGSAMAERTYPGYLSVESFDLQPNQTYPLEIRFQEIEQTPLVFAIAISD